MEKRGRFWVICACLGILSSCSPAMTDDEKNAFKFVSSQIEINDINASRSIEGDLFGDSQIMYDCQMKDSTVLEEEFETYLNYAVAIFYEKLNSPKEYVLSMSISNDHKTFKKDYDKKEMETFKSCINVCENFVGKLNNDSVFGLNEYFVKGFERLDELENGINQINRENGKIDRYDLVKLERNQDSKNQNNDLKRIKVILKTFRKLGENDIILEGQMENNGIKFYSIDI